MIRLLVILFTIKLYAQKNVFKLKYCKKEEFLKDFYYSNFPFLNYTKMLNSDKIVNKNNKNEDEDWPFRMLIIGPSGSEFTRY